MSQTVLQGSDVVFSVTAVSTTQLRYKWFFNGQNANNGFGNGTPSFTVTNVQPDDAGNYSVEVKNSGGRLMSSNAVLTIGAPYFLTCRYPRMTSGGFSFQVLGTTGLNYIILTSSNLTDWKPISTNPAPGGIVNFTDAAATNGLGFYRAQLQLPAAPAAALSDSARVLTVEEQADEAAAKLKK